MGRQDIKKERSLGCLGDSAERRREIPYEELDVIRIHDGGWLGREKVVLVSTSEPSLTVRVHSDLDLESFTDAVQTVLAPYETSVDRREGLGVGLRELLSGLTPR